ncbi:hypothetical protein KSB_68900 [Ktedonobacter robiniae]|uniref:Cas12f1-like TNB domain-containing protein n=1 Tax=Ktedonobacter robiniae TaxID=2778365 RepID=A0ABQ3V198_9CHLR|nr:hypothetical protein KSB_68900 [Ktedonobacter robiniae]
MLTYKCQLYGKALAFLDERNTSKQYSDCGNLQAMPLRKRTYRCAECGLVMDRDENSAHNILMRFLAQRGPYTQGEPECDVLHVTQSGGEVPMTSPAGGLPPAWDLPCEVQVQQLNLFEGV